MPGAEPASQSNQRVTLLQQPGLFLRRNTNVSSLRDADTFAEFKSKSSSRHQGFWTGSWTRPALDRLAGQSSGVVDPACEPNRPHSSVAVEVPHDFRVFRGVLPDRLFFATRQANVSPLKPQSSHRPYFPIVSRINRGERSDGSPDLLNGIRWCARPSLFNWVWASPECCRC